MIRPAAVWIFPIERIARVMLPMIQKYYESDEGKMELETWKQEKREQENG